VARLRRLAGSARPAQALLEATVLGLLFLYLLFLRVESADPLMLANGLGLLCALSGLWAVWRTRRPAGALNRRILAEIGVAAALSGCMGLGVALPARLLGWDRVWLRAQALGPLVGPPLLVATGPGYLLARAGLCLWGAWSRVRRRRLLFALTQAHLVVVAAAILLLMGGWLLSSLSAGLHFPDGDPPDRLLPWLLAYLLESVLPSVVFVGAVSLAVLAILLPPSALFSYFVARRTTRRLEDLARAATALQEGRYDIRVPVSGEDEVALLQGAFNRMAGQLEETLCDLEAQRDRVSAALQSRRELVAAVSHELRTPVATMRATLEPALERRSGDLPAAVQDDLSVVRREIERLQRLIDDLFTLSRAEAHGLELECALIDPAPLIVRVAEGQARLAWSAGRVEVVAELSPDLPLAWADETRLEQCLLNLVRNAMRHTPPGGIIILSARAAGPALVCEVRDTGEGIAPGELPHIWERFYRGTGGADGEPHSGLGLALVKELVEAMGGSVAAESTPGEGSCFTLRLRTAAP